MSKFLPYSRQNVTEKDIDAVVEVLKSDFLTQGKVVSDFESKMCEYTGAKHSVAVCNASAGLHVACLALGLKSGDTLWVPAISFVATANCGLYCGAAVDFIDVEENGCVSISHLSQKLNHAHTNNTLPKAIIVVHLAGHSVDLYAIKSLCDKYSVALIEDAAHALGTAYQGGKIGACIYSDISVFSFHPVKPITSGEGGMITTNNTSLAKTIRLLISHGIERNTENFVNEPDGAWQYEQQMLGFNFRLSDIHSALGLSQMQRVDERKKERQRLACIYNNLLNQNAILSPVLPARDVDSAYHLYLVTCKTKAIRKKLFDLFRASNIGVNVHYIPIPGQPYYKKLGFSIADYPGAIQYSDRTLSLPLFEGMDDKCITKVVDVINKVSSEYSKNENG